MKKLILTSACCALAISVAGCKGAEESNLAVENVEDLNATEDLGNVDMNMDMNATDMNAAATTTGNEAVDSATGNTY